MKQTSLEFYRSNLMALVSTGKTDFKTEPEIFEQAKEKEKQQIIDAYIAGSISLTSKNDAEQYYNETFNK
jgi:hypothetical protein